MVTFGEKSKAVLRTSMGDITLEFLDDKAPRTCDNFAKLARKGFYEGLTFHRILKDFMIQGGCPKGNGTGGPGYTIGPEFNDTPHVKGVVSMARSNDPHSGGSQFFIVHADARYLDSRYSAFARIVDGEEVLDKIASVPVTENRHREPSTPMDPVYINRIELIDIEFDEDEQPRQSTAGADKKGADNGSAGDKPERASQADRDKEESAEASDDAGAEAPEAETARVKKKQPKKQSTETQEEPVEAKAKAKPKTRSKSASKATTKAAPKRASKTAAESARPKRARRSKRAKSDD